jgi:hypothetical protein
VASAASARAVSSRLEASMAAIVSSTTFIIALDWWMLVIGANSELDISYCDFVTFE